MSDKPRRPRIYISGPLTKGNVAQNVASAICHWESLYIMGYNPFCPHLSHFLEMGDTFGCTPRTLEEWLDIDFGWIDVCEALFRIPGESVGADHETARAAEQGKPVFTTDEEALVWIDEWHRRRKALEMNEVEIRRKEEDREYYRRTRETD